MEAADALAALTRRHADAVYRVALSVTRDHVLAEDVAQDSLLKAWQALPTFRGQAPLKNWLLRITHNTAISALRRRRDVHVDPAEMPEAPAIVLIGANIVATFAVAAAERSLGHVSEGIRRRVPPVIKGTILFAAGLIAANQLGVDTTILTLAAAAVLFGAALTAALVAFSGSGPVSTELAAARALRHVVGVGDRVDTDVVTGTIVELHGVKLEVETDEGRRVLVPYSELLTTVVGIDRPAED